MKMPSVDPEEGGGETKVSQRRAVRKCIPSDFHNSFLEHHLFQTTVVFKRFIWEHCDGAGDDNAGDVPRHLLAGRVDEILPPSPGRAANY